MLFVRGPVLGDNTSRSKSNVNHNTSKHILKLSLVYDETSLISVELFQFEGKTLFQLSGEDANLRKSMTICFI